MDEYSKPTVLYLGINYKHEWDQDTIKTVDGVGGSKTKTFLTLEINVFIIYKFVLLLITRVHIPKQ